MRGNTLMPRIGECFLTWRRYLQKGIARHGITLKQYYLLGALSRAEYLHPSDIAGLLYCDRPTATVVIKNMERNGWIAGARDPGDGKRRRIILTAAGRRKRREIEADPDRPEERFSPDACFTAEELKTFRALLGKLSAHLECLPAMPGGPDKEE